MRVEYGPPGHKGVTQIMGLGDYTLPQDKPSRLVGGLAAATLVVGAVVGSSTARNIGIGGVLAIIYVQMLKKPVVAPVAAPNSVQGWG